MLYTIGLTSIGFGLFFVLPLAGLSVFSLYPQQTAGTLAGCVGCFPLPNSGNYSYSLHAAQKACPDQADIIETVNGWDPRSDELLLLVGMMVWSHFLSQEVRVANVGGARVQ